MYVVPVVANGSHVEKSYNFIPVDTYYIPLSVGYRALFAMGNDYMPTPVQQRQQLVALFQGRIGSRQTLECLSLMRDEGKHQ